MSKIMMSARQDGAHLVRALLGASAVAASIALCGAAAAAGQESISVVKDAATGQLRAPTAEEAQQLRDIDAQQKAAAAGKRQSMARSTAPVPGTTIAHPDGSVETVLDEESMSYSVMTRDADGKPVLQCVTGASAAKEAMSAPATSPAREHQHEVK